MTFCSADIYHSSGHPVPIDIQLWIARDNPRGHIGGATNGGAMSKFIHLECRPVFGNGTFGTYVNIAHITRITGTADGGTSICIVGEEESLKCVEQVGSVMDRVKRLCS
jgi:hypothetical protein